MTYRVSETLENTYEGVQFSEAAGLQPSTLLKVDLFIDMKQRFQRRIDVFDPCRRLFIFK